MSTFSTESMSRPLTVLIISLKIFSHSDSELAKDAFQEELTISVLMEPRNVEIWEIKDGKSVLTEFGSAVLSGESKNVPEEWGGGSYSDGISALNFTTVTVNDIDPDTGYTYNPVMWPSEIEKANQNPLNKDWQEHMGASNTMEYLENNDMLLVGAGSSYVQPEENSQFRPFGPAEPPVWLEEA